MYTYNSILSLSNCLSKKKTTLSHPKCFYYLTLTLFNYSLLYIYVCINIYISNSIRLHLTRAQKKKKLYKKQTEYKNPIKLCEKLMND